MLCRLAAGNPSDCNEGKLWVLGVLGVMGGGLRGVDCWREEL